MKKVVLVVPMMTDIYNKREFSNKEFLGVQYLVAIIQRANIDVDYVNAHAYSISNDELCNRITSEGYVFVGISCPSQRSYIFARNLVLKLRKQKFKGHISIGGFFSSLAYHQILNDLPEINTILLGEGEKNIVPLIQQVLDDVKLYKDIDGVAFLDDGQIVYTTPKRIDDLDSLPYPVRDIRALGNLMVYGTDKISNGFFRILAGRGCYG